MRKILILSLILLALLTSVVVTRAVVDEEIEKVTNELSKQKQQLSNLEKRKEQLAKDISSASISLAQVSAELSAAEEDLSKIQKELNQREKTLEQWEKDRNALIRDLYKQSRISPLEILFSSDNLVDSTKQLQYFDDNLKLLKQRITLLIGEIDTFKKNQAKAKELRDDLAALRSQYTSSLYSAQTSYSSVSSQVSEITKYVKYLSEKQKQLLLEKFGAINVSVGDVPPTLDPKLSSSYNPGLSPRLAVFSFGIPHRVGMSQYGAYGRALANQDYKQILKAYYSNVSIGSYSVPSKIKVQGYGDIPFEGKYLRGISEVPRSWPMAVLKAQAVAARTYALNWVSNNPGQAICTTQSCQVYRGDTDRANCNGTYNRRWCDAIEATEGVVIKSVDTGEPITAWYASTAGGYTRSSADVWGGYRSWVPSTRIDTPGRDPSKWFADAYEGVKYGNSPYFYAAWYYAWSKAGNKLVSPQFQHPWFNQKYMNDIVNSVLLYKRDNSLLPYLSAPDWKLPNTWSFSDVVRELQNRGGEPVSRINSVLTIVDKNVGKVSKVRFTVDSGRTVEISGLEFLTVFNTRAPGYIHIKSLYKYPLFNIELK
ncbi:MAG: hypothetical protein BMS9Abin34_034 [Patescibacteria group bacterium]|nr:MAG: hypothetical protein BMS9Abin34_034 [Patescibacteria group bacterium]